MRRVTIQVEDGMTVSELARVVRDCGVEISNDRLLVGASATTQQLVTQLLDRDAHGRKKYGTTLDRTDLSLSDWLQHMAEELMDGAGYALAAKRTLETIRSDALRELLHAVDSAAANVIRDGHAEGFRSEYERQGYEAAIHRMLAAIRTELSR